MILEARWRMENNSLYVEDMQLVYSFDTAHKKGIPSGLGISSLEYDRYYDRLLIVTSSEMTALRPEPAAGSGALTGSGCMPEKGPSLCALNRVRC